MTDEQETVSISKKKAATMLHQLTVTRERERLTPMGDEHLRTATTWLTAALESDP